ncbi:MAG: hypothetical protein ACOYJQ_04465 [Pseudochelatococcus sp.]|jgi:hypothetical protein|uniref:hypothetical protein n=1 Tax=Pseudochelatococcus sp. TaxID=2020869 RepID=UPI003D91FA0D
MENDIRPVSADELTGILRGIADAAGLEAALAIADHAGGTRVSFPAPSRLTPEHWLVGLLGRDAALKVCGHFQAGYGGAIVSIPSPVNDFRSAAVQREKAMLRAFFSTATIDEAARTVSVDRSTVIRHFRRLRDDGFRRPLRNRKRQKDGANDNGSRHR